MRPTHGISCRGVSQRVRAPSSARGVIATVHGPPPTGLEGRNDRLPPPRGDLHVEVLLQTRETFGVVVDGEEWDWRQRCTLPGVYGMGAALHASLSQQASMSTTGVVRVEERRP